MIPSLHVAFVSDDGKEAEANLIRNVTALANAGGGSVYFGVSADGKRTNLKKTHTDGAALQTLLLRATVPPLAVRVRTEPFAGGTALVIRVPAAEGIVADRQGTAHLRAAAPDGSFLCKPLFPEEIVSAYGGQGRVDLTAAPLYGWPMEALDQERMTALLDVLRRQGLYGCTRTTPEDEVLRRCGLTAADGKRVCPTVAAVLVAGAFSQPDALREVMRLRFLWREKRRPEKELLIEGTLPELYRGAMEALTQAYERFAGQGEALFSLSAAEEGVRNALMHRDYATCGEVSVRVGEDAVRITSPGAPPYGAEIALAPETAPRARNPVLATVLRAWFAEEDGSARGMQGIFAESIRAGLPPPDYAASDAGSVTLTLPRALPDEAFVRLLPGKRKNGAVPYGADALQVLWLLKEMETADLADLCGLTHLPVTRMFPVIDRLFEDGLIEEARDGDAYRLTQTLYTRPGRLAKYARLTEEEKASSEDRVLRYARERGGEIVKQDVAACLNVTPAQAYACIRRLTTQGKLAIVYGGKYARYKVVS